MPKKKKEKPEIYHTPFGTTTIPPYPEIDLNPYTAIATTALGDSQRRFITAIYPETSVTYTDSTDDARTVYYPPKHWESYSTIIEYENFMGQLGKEEEAKVKVNLEKFKGKYVCCVRETLDLLPERILITLSAVKGRLMIEVAPIRIKEFQCSMTPAVRKNIIQASKRARMYGKKIPIIARFDEFGNELPEQIEINDAPGVNIRILDPEDYGELYFEMVAIESPNSDYTITRDASWFSSDSLFSPDDIPF